MPNRDPSPAPTRPPAPARPGSARTGAGTIERQALARVQLDVRSMPASDVVQLVLWPDTIANWARSAQVSSPVAYNMLGRVKPYRRVRELLAHRLTVPTFVLDHLIDAARPLPSAMQPPDPLRPHATEPPVAHPLDDPSDPDSMRLLLPTVRDGSNPLERIAVERVQVEVAALPASLIVQLALYPETLAAWARRQNIPAPLLYSTLAAGQPNQRIRHALAARLGVSPKDVDWLVDAVRPEPRATRPPTLADAPESAAPPDAAEAHRPTPDGGASPNQLSFKV